MKLFVRERLHCVWEVIMGKVDFLTDSCELYGSDTSLWSLDHNKQSNLCLRLDMHLYQKGMRFEFCQYFSTNIFNFEWSSCGKIFTIRSPQYLFPATICSWFFFPICGFFVFLPREHSLWSCMTTYKLSLGGDRHEVCTSMVGRSKGKTSPWSWIEKNSWQQSEYRQYLSTNPGSGLHEKICHYFTETISNSDCK